MFSQFGATSDTLSKASTMVFRIGTDAHLYDDPEDVNISPLLDSKFDSEKCEALKRLLALIAQGFDVSNYFPQVVKNVASQSFEVKKLVYVYLLHYAEKRPNEALLSINCFQKDLVDINPLVRAWALRTMAGIRLHVIAPIVLMAVGKCARDPSVYVRKCAANALPKLNDLRIDENASAIEEIIGILLNDTSPGVVGAAASAFNSVCPSNLPFIGRSFRRLCEILPDVEEWGQIILIEILLRYLVAKHGLVKESIMYSACGTESSNSQDEASAINPTPDENGNIVDEICKSRIAKLVTVSYIEAPDEYLSRSNCRYGNFLLVDDGSFTSAESNEDVKLLLKCTSPLLWSHNSAVVLAAAGVHWIVAPRGDVERIVKPLLFVLRSSSASKYVVLCNIQVFAKAIPSLFAPYYEEFFISASDSYQVKALKLGILSGIATESSIPQIFMEFQDYIRDPDRRFAADTVAAIGLCAERLPSYANRCMEGLLSLTRHELKMRGIDDIDGEAGILVQAVLSIRAIVGQDAPAYEKVIVRLVRSLDSIKVPAVRAIIIWMVGEYSSTGKILQKTSTIVLKYLVHCFTTEASETKLQILNTSAKVLLCANKEDMHTLRTSVCFLLDLAKSDMNYDVRDRARFLKNILTSCLEPQGQDLKQTTLCKESVHLLAEKILGAQKFTVSDEHSNDRFYLPGSLSLIVLHAAPGYEPLPKPCSLSHADHLSNEVHGGALTEDSYETDNSSISGSVDERSASSYSSQQSTSDSNSIRGSDDCLSASGDEENSHPLIHLDTADAEGVQSADTMQIMSKRTLESWLTEEPSPSELLPYNQVHRSARISVFDIGHRVQPKSYTLLDTASGNGLKVDYSFSSESSSSPLLICLDVSFQNCSNEPLLEVILMEESDKGPNQASGTTERSSATEKDVPSILPMEEIEILEPGQMIKRLLQVRFNHHLLPLKLALRCNGQKYSVRLRPDIGYFVKPLPMDIEAFTSKEAQLPGMFEYMRRCTFADHVEDVTRDRSYRSFVKDVYLAICERLALKMLGNANLCLVSVDMPVDTKLDDASGLCLRFSCEILRNSVPCLITITVDGNCFEPLNLTVKVNCEETVFGLNLLNRIVSFLAESTSSQL